MQRAGYTTEMTGLKEFRQIHNSRQTHPRLTRHWILKKHVFLFRKKKITFFFSCKISWVKQTSAKPRLDLLNWMSVSWISEVVSAIGLFVLFEAECLL